jgi:ABC-type multidrug transport system permease subunit
VPPTGWRDCRFPLVRQHRTRNGAGKTTAVRILATLIKPDEGRASVCGYDVVRDAHQVRQLIGLTGQYASVDEGLSVAVTIGFGMILGFRVTTNPVSAIAGCLLLLVFALAMCWVSALLGLLVKTPQGVQVFGSIAIFPLVFGSSLLVPTATMPGWLQAFVKVNPITDLSAAERGLFTGGPVASPAIKSLLWALGIFIVFAPLAVRAYRRRT